MGCKFEKQSIVAKENQPLPAKRKDRAYLDMLNDSKATKTTTIELLRLCKSS